MMDCKEKNVADDLKIVRNISSVPQQIVLGGKLIVLKPGDEERMDAKLADKFVRECEPHVEFVDEEELNVFDPDSANDIVWLANVTGNPAFPQKLPVRTLRQTQVEGRIRKEWVTDMVDNPSAQAHPISRNYAPGQVSYTGRDGSYLTKTLPEITITIPPYKRRPVRKDIAEWFMRRDASSGAGHAGSTIISRKPSNFEPDMSWSLDDMRAYLKLISSEMAELGPDEAELLKIAKRQKLDARGSELLLKETKEKVLKDLWYFVADRRYKLPTKAQFREYVSGKSSEELAAEQAQRLLEQAEVSGRLSDVTV
jgi:hypothetical protein